METNYRFEEIKKRAYFDALKVTQMTCVEWVEAIELVFFDKTLSFVETLVCVKLIFLYVRYLNQEISRADAQREVYLTKSIFVNWRDYDHKSKGALC